MSEHQEGPPHRQERSVRVYRKSRWRRVADAVTGALVRAGLVPHSYLLTTVGRRTGLSRTVPVTLVEDAGRRWLVAPYGPVGWVHNARAAGTVTLSRRGYRGTYRVREVEPVDAGPVLKRYIGIAPATRAYFRAKRGAPVSEFVAEADRHPVFELTPLD